MSQRNYEINQKMETAIKRKLNSIDSFYQMAKSFSIKTDNFLKQFYELVMSFLQDDFQDVEYPFLKSNKWDIVEHNRRINSAANTDILNQSDVQDYSQNRGESNDNMFRLLQIMKEQNQEMVEFVMKESSNSTSVTEYIEKLFENLKNSRSLPNDERNYEKQKSKIKNLKKKILNLEHRIMEYETTEKIYATQVKTMNEELSISNVRQTNEQDVVGLSGSCCVKSEATIENLKQQVVKINSQNNALKIEYENSINVVKHLERNLLLLKQDIFTLFESFHGVKLGMSSNLKISDKTNLESVFYDEKFMKSNGFAQSPSLLINGSQMQNGSKELFNNQFSNHMFPTDGSNFVMKGELGDSVDFEKIETRFLQNPPKLPVKWSHENFIPENTKESLTDKIRKTIFSVDLNEKSKDDGPEDEVRNSFNPVFNDFIAVEHTHHRNSSHNHSKGGRNDSFETSSKIIENFGRKNQVDFHKEIFDKEEEMNEEEEHVKRNDYFESFKNI